MDSRDHETEERVEAAKASFVAHADELGRRLRGARERFDLPAKIAQHPQLAIGIAAAAGALLGLLAGPRIVRVSRGADSEVKRGLLAAGATALGGLAIQLVKDFAVRQIVNHASHWIDETERGVSPTEAAASSVPETAAFFRH